MRISRFYYNGVLKIGARIHLPIETSHYFYTVLRLKVGMNVILFNGDGRDYSANILDLTKKTVVVEVIDSLLRINESPLTTHLAQAISRSEKMDFVIQKSVELGVTQITPLLTEYCSVKLNPERIEKRYHHWKKIIISACEQSGRAFIPELTPIAEFKDWIKEVTSMLKIYCDPLAKIKMTELPRENNVLVLIGPEGGLSDHEILTARETGFIGVSLGPRTLRTETAPLVSLAILQSLWGDI